MLLDNFFKISDITRDDNNTKFDIVIELNPHHPIYEGHFPGNPVVPGVCMQQMIKESLSFIIEKPLLLNKADNIKFLSIIIPEMNNKLKLGINIRSSADDLIKIDSNISYAERTFFKYTASFKIDTR